MKGVDDGEWSVWRIDSAGEHGNHMCMTFD